MNRANTRVFLHPSSFRLHPSRRAFTLIEMLTIVAMLIILLGLMVNIARRVRDQSAQQLTQSLLRQIDSLMAQYIERSDGAWPKVGAILAPDAIAPPEPKELADRALKNNEQWVGVIENDFRRRFPDQANNGPFHQQPISIFDSKAQTLRDAWGSPIIFMARQHALIGLAPSRSGKDQFFFFSAGPDRNYLTREDNIYSYETGL